MGKTLDSECVFQQWREQPRTSPPLLFGVVVLPLCDPMNSSTPGFFVLHHLPEFAQIRVH